MVNVYNLGVILVQSCDMFAISSRLRTVSEYQCRLILVFSGGVLLVISCVVGYSCKGPMCLADQCDLKPLASGNILC